MKSLPPPGATVTMIRTGLVGYGCAPACPAPRTAKNAATSTASRLLISFFPRSSWFDPLASVQVEGLDHPPPLVVLGLQESRELLRRGGSRIERLAIERRAV